MLKRIFCLLILLLIISQFIYATNGTVVYRSTTGTFTTSSPKIRNWSSAGIGSYSAEVELPTAGSPIRYALIKYSPVSPKRVIVTQSIDGYIDAYVSFDGEEWNVSNNIGQVWTTAPTTPSRRFNFEYESSTGDLILVYSIVSTSVTCDLAYRVLPANETTFGPEICIDDPTQTNDIQYTWIEAARNPENSEEIIFVGFDSTSTDSLAYVWNGSAFRAPLEITSNAPSTGGYKAIAVAYTPTGSLGMVASGDGTNGSVATFYWTGSNWVDSPDFDIDLTDAADVYWLDIVPHPTLPVFQAVFIDNAQDLGTAYWNGSAWPVASNIDTSVDTAVSSLADFAWLPNGTLGRLVWDTDTTGSTLSVRVCNPQCDRSATTTISTYGGIGSWLYLYTNPTAAETVDIIGLRLNGAQNLGSFYFDGTNFVNYGDTALASTVGVVDSDPFSFDFQRAFDTQAPSYSNQSQSNNTIIVGGTNYLSVVWTDNVQLKTAILETNETGTWQNKTVYGSPVSMRGTYYVVNFTWNNASIPAGTIVGWRVWASDRSNNWNVTPIMNFTVLAPPVYNFTVTPSTDSFTVYNNTYIDRNYTLNNTGNRNLSITCTTNATWVYNITACPSILTPGSVINVTFRYNATGLSPANYLVNLTFSDPNVTRYALANVSVIPSLNPTVYTDKLSYGTCNIIYFRVSVYNINDQLIDAQLNNSLLDATNTTVLSESVVTGNGGTGVYLGVFVIPTGYTPGNWIIRAVSGTVKGQKTIQVS